MINSSSDDTSDYAFVINNSSSVSTSADNLGTITYTAKLLLTDGTTVSYTSYYNAADLKGKLVTYKLYNVATSATTTYNMLI